MTESLMLADPSTDRITYYLQLELIHNLTNRHYDIIV
jgi:hypothetical protein